MSFRYDDEHGTRFHWNERHSSRDSDRDRHSGGSREHDPDRWIDDRSEDRRHRRRRDLPNRDRWCCPDWEQTEHGKKIALLIRTAKINAFFFLNNRKRCKIQ